MRSLPFIQVQASQITECFSAVASGSSQRELQGSCLCVFEHLLDPLMLRRRRLRPGEMLAWTSSSTEFGAETELRARL